jgi:hypothetical protein
LCVAEWPRCELTSGRINRQQAQEDLRPNADPGSAEASQEKIDGREIADPETNSNAREIFIAEEKNVNYSHALTNAGAEPFRFVQKEKIFPEPVA